MLVKIYIMVLICFLIEVVSGDYSVSSLTVSDYVEYGCGKLCLNLQNSDAVKNICVRLASSYNATYQESVIRSNSKCELTSALLRNEDHVQGPYSVEVGKCYFGQHNTKCVTGFGNGKDLLVWDWTSLSACDPDKVKTDFL